MVLTSIHNLCFEQKYLKKISDFSVFGGKIIYLNRHVFVMAVRKLRFSCAVRSLCGLVAHCCGTCQFMRYPVSYFLLVFGGSVLHCDHLVEVNGAGYLFFLRFVVFVSSIIVCSS